MSLSSTVRKIIDRTRSIQEKAYDDLQAYAILDDRGESTFVKARNLEEAGERFLEERIRTPRPFPRPECGAGPPLWVRYETSSCRIIVCQAHHLRDFSNSKRRK